MEADLQRWHNTDYRDRWREPGSLTLRRLAVLLSHLPPDSALARIAREGDEHWSVEAHLLDNLRIVLTSTKEKPAKPHPARPGASKRLKPPTPERARKLAQARRRAAERRKAREEA